jgi:hypothetical protein
MNTTRYRSLTALFAVTLLSALAACQDKKPALRGAGMDMFTPVKMRLHPLSRLVPGTGPGAQSTAEARLELTDQFGDIVKGAGVVYCELFTWQALGQNNRGERIGLWNFDLNTPEANKQHWDGITRTYLCKLPLPQGVNAVLKTQGRLILSATWTLPNGARISDDMTLSLK